MLPSRRCKGRTLKGATVNRELECLTCVLDLAAQRKYIPENPTRAAKHFNELRERPAKQMLTLEQENRILNAASPHLRVGIILLVQTGGRTYSEGFRLRWDQVDWENRLIHFGNDVKTAGSSEPLPLTDLALIISDASLPRSGIIRLAECSSSQHPQERAKNKGDSQMKMLLRFSTSMGVALLMGAASFGQHYTQTNLVSNTPGIAPVTDSDFVNAWGLSRGPDKAWWISENVTGFAALYNGAGVEQSLTVTIPPADPTNKNTPTGSPTASIFNGSQTDFLLATGKPAQFLFATVDGTIAGWNPTVGVAQGAAPPSTHAVTVVRTTDGSAYTGLTRAFVNGKAYLYAANFSKGRVDIYDSAFHRVKPSQTQSDGDSQDSDGPFPQNSFVDNALAPTYVPFNVHAIGNDIVVTYALHLPGSPLETDGPGLGFVDIYDSRGRLLRRLEHGDWLNAPWGVALAPLDFGRFSHDLLVGQFAGAGDTQSSGLIAAYDLATGKLDGLLEDANGNPLAINGIWSLSVGNVSPDNRNAAAEPAGQVYFTAGPNQQSRGLFGFLTAVPAELTEGNGQ